MKTCEDCGCRLSSGICSNCDEELYIEEYQGEFIDFPLSPEWREKVSEQVERVQVRRRTDAQRMIDKGDTLDYDIEDDFITKRKG